MSGFVYLLRGKGTSFYKIGFSTCPSKRAKELQTGLPFDLLVVATWTGTIRDEKKAHRELKQYHARGEWYQYAHSAETLIGSISTVLSRPVTAADMSNVARAFRVHTTPTTAARIRELLPTEPRTWWEIIPKTYGVLLRRRKRETQRLVSSQSIGTLTHDEIDYLLRIDRPKAEHLIADRVAGKLAEITA